MTLIPREGGNTFHGAFFGGYTGNGFQAHEPDSGAEGPRA